jgi:amino acid adenylation domain-containing protein
MTETLSGYNLSSFQKRTWLFLQAGHALNVQATLHISGMLHISLLQTVWAELVSRHEACRTTFVPVNNAVYPLQVIGAPYIPAITLQENVTVKELSNALFNKHYTLNSAPLLDLLLVRQSPEQHVLIVQLPALCADNHSLNILLREMITLYNRSAAANDEPPHQFVQFSEWQLAMEEENIEDKAVQQQHAALCRFKAVQLPVHPVPDQSRIVSTTVHIDSSALTGIRQLVQEHGLTLPGFFMGIWHTVLSQYAGEGNALTIAMAFDGRTHEAFEGIVGPLQKFIPVTVTTSAKDTLLSCIKAVADETGAVKVWEDSFSWPVNDTPSYAGEYYVTALSDPAYQLLDVNGSSEPFALKLQCLETPDRIQLTWLHDTAVVLPAAVAQISAHMTARINAILKDQQIISGDCIQALPAEVSLLHEFNDTTCHFTSAGSLKAAFENQVSATPAAVALVAGDMVWTYATLNEKANILAHRMIREYQLQPGQTVAVKLKRSPELIVSLLAVVKTGAAFLPLDIAIPANRLSFLLDDSKSALLLTDETAEVNIPLLYPGDLSAQEEKNTDNPGVEISSENIAYIIYTSGSTGRPKGVCISNSALLNYVYWFRHTYHISGEDRTMLFSSVAFDLCYTSLWPSLISGAQLHLYPEAPYLEPSLLNEKLIAGGITYIKLTPSHLKILLADPDFKHRAPQYKLRMIVVGGEKIAPENLRPFFDVHPGLLVVNHYGPTETTIGTATCNITAASWPLFSQQPVIGMPIANNGIFILGDDDRLLPIGVTGLLTVTGKGVAAGYLNNTVQTAGQFVALPHITDGTLYRTGDLGRWLANGTIEFFGRKDAQLKIRGFRIEPGEIIDRLLQLEKITTADVLAEEDVLSVCYQADAPLTDALLRQHMAAELPVYMIPAHFIWLRQWPLTPNGKTDRNALTAAGRKVLAGNPFVSPQTATEVMLCKIFSEILGHDNISIHDNFFAIGGHSLKAVQVISRIYELTGRRINLRELFDAPAIAGLAALLDSAASTGYERIPCLPSAGAYALSHAQKRLWILDQLGDTTTAYNMPAAYHLEGPLQVTALEQALHYVIARHEILRTTFNSVDGVPLQVVHDSAAGFLNWRYIDLRQQPDAAEKAAQIAGQAAAVVFDLSHGPLLEMVLIQTAQQQFVLVFTMHHIIGDAWSLDLLFREILDCYHAYSNGQTPLLPVLPLQYKDYAAWHNNLLKDESLRKYRQYWLDQLSGELPVLQFPVDNPRPAVKQYQGDTCSTVIPAPLAQAVRQTAARHSATLFMALLAGINALLYRYTGQQDIIIGSPIAGRDHKDLEGQVGLYLNNLSIRTQFRNDSTFSELLQIVRQQCLGAYEHQEYPFDLLVSELQLKRDLSRSPLFDVVVVLQNAEDNTAAQPAAIPDVQIRRFDSGFRMSTIDLRIVFTEVNEMIACTVDYSTALFRPATMERFLHNYISLLEQVTANDSTCVNEIDMGAQLSVAQPLTEYETKFNF